MRHFVGFEVAATAAVSPLWRWLPLVGYPLTAAAGLVCAVAVGTTVGRLHDQCPLYARPSVAAFDGVNVTLNEQSDDPQRTHWGDSDVCNLAEFFPIFTVIFSAAWFFFFCMCGKGGKGSPQGFGMDSPWRIVCPGLVFNLAMTVAALVGGVWTSQGVRTFCDSLQRPPHNVSCAYLGQMHFPQYPTVSHLDTWFVVAEVCSWLVFSGLLCVTLLLTLRCLVRPDLMPLYAPAGSGESPPPAAGESPPLATGESPPSADDTDLPPRPPQYYSSTDSFMTADATPQHGPGGDADPQPQATAKVHN